MACAKRLAGAFKAEAEGSTPKFGGVWYALRREDSRTGTPRGGPKKRRRACREEAGGRGITELGQPRTGAKSLAEADCGGGGGGGGSSPLPSDRRPEGPVGYEQSLGEGLLVNRAQGREGPGGG